MFSNFCRFEIFVLQVTIVLYFFFFFQIKIMFQIYAYKCKHAQWLYNKNDIKHETTMRLINMKEKIPNLTM